LEVEVVGASVRSSRRAIVTGYLFKLIRESIPRSQETLAADLELDRGTIQGWESGRRPFTAMPLGQAVALRHRLAALGADSGLLGALDVAVEADYLIAQIIDIPPAQVHLNQHPLGWTVMTRTLVEMLAWPVTGQAPGLVANSRRTASTRRGPVAPAPLLDSIDRERFFANLRILADRAVGSSGPVVLVRRQSCYLLSEDSAGSASEWLTNAKEVDLHLSPRPRWSPTWPLARSVATSLARQGDLEPLREFIARAHLDDSCESAALNYWAYWVGEIPTTQRGDHFMVENSYRWAGNKLFRHIVRRLDGAHCFRDLYVHTLWALLIARPRIAWDDPTTARSLYRQSCQLLDEQAISAQSRRELATIMSTIRVEGSTG
jgi:DNA-binding XRE family transcriptional regulator